MANEVGKLSVILSLSGTTFSKGIEQARKHLGQFSKDFGSIRNLVAGGLGVVGIGLTANAFKNMVSEQLAAIDTTAKLSAALGTTVEQLQAIQSAAGQGGIGDIGKALSTMRKNLGEAAQGKGEAGGVLAALGLDPASLAQMDSTAAFLAIAKGFDGIQDSATKSAMAVKLFGEQGAALVPFMKDADASIQSAVERLAALGITLTTLDAARVEMAGDALARMQEAATGVAQQITAALAPAITLAADKTLAWLLQTDGAATKVNHTLGFTVKSLGYVADYANLALSVFYLIKAGIAGIGTVMLAQRALIVTALVNPLLLAAKAANALTGEFDGLIQVLETERDASQFAVAGMAEEAAKALGQSLDASEAFHRGDASKAVAAFFEEAKAESDKQAGALTQKQAPIIADAFASSLVTADGLTHVGDVLADSLIAGMDNAESRLKVFAGQAMEAMEIFSPGRLESVQFGSVGGFRAMAGLQNQPALQLQRESVKLEREQRDLLTELRDLQSDTVTVTI